MTFNEAMMQANSDERVFRVALGSRFGFLASMGSDIQKYITPVDRAANDWCIQARSLEVEITEETTTITTTRLNLLLDLEAKVLALRTAEKRCTSTVELRRLQAEVDTAADACERGSK